MASRRSDDSASAAENAIVPAHRRGFFRRLQSTLATPLRRRHRRTSAQENAPKEPADAIVLHSSPRRRANSHLAVGEWSQEVFTLHDEDETPVLALTEQSEVEKRARPRAVDANAPSTSAQSVAVVSNVHSPSEAMQASRVEPTSTDRRFRATAVSHPGVRGDNKKYGPTPPSAHKRASPTYEEAAPQERSVAQIKRLSRRESVIGMPLQDDSLAHDSLMVASLPPPDYDRVMQQLDSTPLPMRALPALRGMSNEGGAAGAAEVHSRIKSLQQDLSRAMEEIESKDKKLNAALLSMKLFWGPELEKERNLRVSEKQRADAAAALLRDRESLLRRQEHQLALLQKNYDNLRASASRRARLFEEIELHLRMQTESEREAAAASEDPVSRHAAHIEDSSDSLRLKLQRRDETIARLRLEIEELKSQHDQDVTSKRDAYGGSGDARDFNTLSRSSAPSNNQEQAISNYEESVRDLQAKLERAQTTIDSQRQQLSTQEHEAEQAHNEARSMQSAVSTLETRLGSALDELESTKARLTDAMDGQKEALQQLRSTQAEVEALELAKQDAEARCFALKQEIRSLQNDRTELRSKLADAQTASFELEAERRSHTEAAAEERRLANEKVKALEAELAKLENESQSTKQATVADTVEDQARGRNHAWKLVHLYYVQVVSVRCVIESSGLTGEEHSSQSAEKEEMAKLRKQVRQLKAASKTASSEQAQALTALRQELESVRALESKAKAALASSQRRVKELKECKQSLEQQVTDMRSRMESLEQDLKSKSRQLHQTKKTLNDEKGARRQAEAQLKETNLEVLRKEESTKSLCEDYEKRLVVMEARLEATTTELQTAHKERQHDVQRIEDISSKQTHTSTELDKAKEELEIMHRLCKSKSETVDQLTQELQEAREKVIFERTNALLQRVSEHDERIAAMELKSKSKNSKELAELYKAREADMLALREQFQKRAELQASTIGQSSPNASLEVSRQDLLERLEVRETEARRLRSYVDQLLGEILRQDDSIATEIMTGLPRLQQNKVLPLEEIRHLSDEALYQLSKERDRDNKLLESYIDQILQRVVEVQPSILEMMTFSVA